MANEFGEMRERVERLLTVGEVHISGMHVDRAFWLDSIIYFAIDFEREVKQAVLRDVRDEIDRLTNEGLNPRLIQLRGILFDKGGRFEITEEA